MKSIRILWFLVLALSISACGTAGGNAGDAPLTGIRAPQPTFTPTPIQPLQPASEAPAPLQDSQAQASTDNAPPAPQSGNAESSAGSSAGSDVPQIVVNSPLVNVRTGPSTNYDIVATVERGQEFEIVGRDPQGEWWFVCCADSEYVWISSGLVDTNGAVDSVPITGGATEAGAATEANAAPAADTVVTPQVPTTAPVAQFNLIRQEQFAETGLVRVFLFVTDGVVGLADYSVRITKDGRELPVNATSFGGQPAFTWPFQDARQRHQNFKVEFAEEAPAGVWEVQLINADGVAVGPTARFTLAADDPQRELYLRYERQ